jgi:cytochrome c biogenesis protein CcmG/thiol:disulfide interchange protein DsbE
MKRLLFMFLAISAMVGCSDETAQLLNGQPAPGFQLQQLKGGNSTFPADYQNKVVALRFWADWCPFCESEMIALEPVYEKYRDRGLVILAVNVRQDRDTAQKFIGKLGISYEALLDTEGEVARAYGVMGLPTTFFIDGKGILQKRILGESTPEVFEQIVQELLK